MEGGSDQLSANAVAPKSSRMQKTKKPLFQFLFADRRVVEIAGTLLLLDLLFVFVHGIKFLLKERFIEEYGYWLYRNLTLTNDWSIPEITNYLKFVVIVYLLWRVFVVVRQPIYLAWAFVFAIALIDDSCQMHEALGNYFSSTLSSVTLFGRELQTDQGFRIQDAGELIVYALYGGVILVALGFGFLKSNPLHRKIGLGFALLLGVLAFFVVAVDMLVRVVVSHSQMLAHVVTTVEDSGEMFVASLTVAFALIVYRRYGPNASDGDYPVTTAPGTSSDGEGQSQHQPA